MDHAAIEVGEDCGPLATMLGGLLRANLQADPAKAALVGRTSGTVGIVVTDTAEELRLHLTGDRLSITAGPVDDVDLRLVGAADTILGLSTVPLRFGLPDLLSTTGRSLTGRWVGGGLQIHGLPRAAPLLRAVLSLLNVLA